MRIGYATDRITRPAYLRLEGIMKGLVADCSCDPVRG